MSSERGNAVRSRPQKYQNHVAYKKDRYGTTPETKALDSLKIEGLCDRCHGVIEWKIRFKKYKKLTVPSRCTTCLQKTVKEAYHTICRPCASASGKCPKCCEDHAANRKTSSENGPGEDESGRTREKLDSISEQDPLGVERKKNSSSRTSSPDLSTDTDDSDSNSE